MKTTRQRVTVDEAEGCGSRLEAGTYLVEMPADYDPELITGEDILCDADIRIVDEDEPVFLATRIPEDRGTLPGLDYGAHTNGQGWSGYHVRPTGRDDLPWGIAKMSPEADRDPYHGGEPEDLWPEIVESIADELEDA